jgi:hypothetical protein
MHNSPACRHVRQQKIVKIVKIVTERRTHQNISESLLSACYEAAVRYSYFRDDIWFLESITTAISIVGEKKGGASTYTCAVFIPARGVGRSVVFSHPKL